VATELAVANAIVRRLQRSAHGGHQKSPRSCLFLFDALVIFNLAIVHLLWTVALNRHGGQIVLAEIVRHARVLLRWHVSPHPSNVIKSALFSSGAATDVAGRSD